MWFILPLLRRGLGRGILLLSCWVSAQQTEWQWYDFKGKVKTAVEEFYFVYDDQAEEMPYNSLIYSFSEDGKHCRIFAIDRQSDNPHQTVEYEAIIALYDDKGRKTQMLYYDPHGSLTHRVELVTYDSHGNAIQADWYQGETLYGSQHRKYNENGKVTEQFFVQADGSCQGKLRFHHDSHGRLQSSVFEPIDNITPTQKVLYIYDTNGNIIEARSTNGQTHYTYDHHGNWITQTELYQGVKKSIKKRKITYYK